MLSENLLSNLTLGTNIEFHGKYLAYQFIQGIGASAVSASVLGCTQSSFWR